MTAATRTHTVLIADDHPLVAHGIERVLDGGDFTVVAVCHSGAAVLETAPRLRPELVLLDVRLGDMNGADVCRRLGDEVPGAKVVVLTAYSDIENLHRCLESGAAGVLLKATIDLDLRRALHEVRAGRMVVDSGVARELEAAGGILRSTTSAAPHLRPRELEVLRLMAAGMTTRDIADELELSVNTVRTYTQSLMTKLDAHTRVQAIVFAQQRHLV